MTIIITTVEVFIVLESTIRPVAGCVYSEVSHPGQQGQVVITCVEDPYSDTTHSQLFGKLKSMAHLFEG